MMLSDLVAALERIHHATIGIFNDTIRQNIRNQISLLCLEYEDLYPDEVNVTLFRNLYLDYPYRTPFDFKIARHFKKTILRFPIKQMFESSRIEYRHFLENFPANQEFVYNLFGGKVTINTHAMELYQNRTYDTFPDIGGMHSFTITCHRCKEWNPLHYEQLKQIINQYLYQEN